MRKSVYFVLVFMLITLFVVSGCEADEVSEPDEPAEVDEVVEPTDDYPGDETIKIIVPFSEGGSLDMMVRGLTPYLAEELGTNIVVENHAGADGQIGASQYINHEPRDGTSVLAHTSPFFNSTILRGADYSLEDFDYINMQQVSPVTIAVNVESDYMTLEDLIEDIKANPGQIAWGTIMGGSNHLAGILLDDMFDLDTRMVTYDGGGPYRTALVGGEVDYVFGSIGDTAVDDQIRVLAVLDEERLGVWPDSPTINEALEPYGEEFPSLFSSRWFAFHGGFREEYPERWDIFMEAYTNVLESDEYKQYLEDSGEAEVTRFTGPDRAREMTYEVHEVMEQYWDQIYSE